MFIATLDGNKIIYNKTKIKENEFSCYTKNLGKLFLTQDNIAPTVAVTNISLDKTISAQKTIEVTISDSLSGIKEYNGYINGVWALFEYDFKSKKMRHQLDDGIVNDGKNDLKVVVSDNVGNVTTFETTFTYKKI